MTAAEIQEALADPFPPDKVGWKAQTAKESRALAVAYIDARDVMDRLDAVVGIHNWKDEYIPQPDGNVICILSVRIDGEWVSKSDIGGPSEQRDPGDKEKAAFSDALKRTAVKFGVARYLYNLEGGWVEYDDKYKKLLKTPQLPEWALPRAMRKGAKAASTQEPANGAPKAPPAAKKAPPRTYAELHAEVKARDGELAKQGIIKAGEFLAALGDYAVEQKFPVDGAAWSESHVKAAMAHLGTWKQSRVVERHRQASQATAATA